MNFYNLRWTKSIYIDVTVKVYNSVRRSIDTISTFHCWFVKLILIPSWTQQSFSWISEVRPEIFVVEKYVSDLEHTRQKYPRYKAMAIHSQNVGESYSTVEDLVIIRGTAHINTAWISRSWHISSREFFNGSDLRHVRLVNNVNIHGGYSFRCHQMSSFFHLQYFSTTWSLWW